MYKNKKFLVIALCVIFIWGIASFFIPNREGSINQIVRADRHSIKGLKSDFNFNHIDCDFNINAKYKIKKHFKYSYANINGDVNLDLSNMDIKIERSQDAKFYLDAYIDIRSDELKKLPDDYFKVDTSKDLAITQKSIKNYSNYSEHSYMILKVPDNFKGSIDANTQNGDVILKDVKQDISVDTYNGDVNAQNLIAKTDLETKNGDIDGENIKNNITASSNNGDISVGFSKQQIEYVDLSTNRGDVSVTGLKPDNMKVDVSTSMGDFDLSDEFERKLDMKDEKDDYNVGGKIDQKIGEGKNTLKLTTDMGDIEIK